MLKTIISVQLLITPSLGIFFGNTQNIFPIGYCDVDCSNRVHPTLNHVPLYCLLIYGRISCKPTAMKAIDDILPPTPSTLLPINATTPEPEGSPSSPVMTEAMTMTMTSSADIASTTPAASEMGTVTTTSPILQDTVTTIMTTDAPREVTITTMMPILETSTSAGEMATSSSTGLLAMSSSSEMSTLSVSSSTEVEMTTATIPTPSSSGMTDLESSSSASSSTTGMTDTDVESSSSIRTTEMTDLPSSTGTP